jgi:hypothetical protein
MTDWLNLGLKICGVVHGVIAILRLLDGDTEGAERAMTLGILFVLLGNTK